MDGALPANRLDVNHLLYIVEPQWVTERTHLTSQAGGVVEGGGL